MAVPPVLGYNALLPGNQSIRTKLHRFANDLHAYFVTGPRVGNSSVDGKVVAMKKA